MHTRTTTSRWKAAVLAALTVAGGIAAAWPSTAARADSAPLDPGAPATPQTVTADPLPTVQIDGVAWSQVVVGDTVYVAGKFQNARPAGAAPGTSLTPRRNLLAYDIRTGALITSFAPNLNGQALAVTASPDGSRIYVGGDFTTADGQPRSRVAAYSTATGQLVSDFKPAVNAEVRAIAVSGTTVYLGGKFSAVGTAARARLAAFTPAGALLPWAPRPGVGSTTGNRDGNKATSSDVLALVVTGGGAQVVAAGRFDSLNGVKATGVGAIDATTGATRPFAANRLITNQGVNSAILSLSTDGTTVYGAGYDFYGPGDLEGLFAAAADGGTVRWFADCRGDSYGTFATNGVLYSASHAHDCINIGSFPQTPDPVVHMFANAMTVAATGKNTADNSWNNGVLAGQPAPTHLPWAPAFEPGTFTGQGQAGWNVTGNGTYVAYGGEFPAVNGFKQQGLVRFAVPSASLNRVGPKAAAGSTFAPSATMVPGAVRVTWKAVSDKDNEYLTYRVYRDSTTSTPVCQTNQPSLWWKLPTYGCTDSTATSGSHRWLVTATDPFGNSLSSTWVTATVPAASVGKSRPYTQAVLADGATDSWSLGEASGTTGYDYAGPADLTVNAGVSRKVAGAITGDTDTASQFNGATNGFAATRTAIQAPQVFSEEAWFATTTKAGGKLIGFGNANTGTSWQNDRNVYMDTAGKVWFGVWTGENRTVGSPAAYNDGRWHHVVATLSSRGMALYLDGVLVGSRSDTTSAERMTGYWRIGGDTSWSGAPFFAGRIDEVAIYSRALTAKQVTDHFALASTGSTPNVTPTASFTSSTADLVASLDGSGSTDPDGRVTTWAWDFGDGTTGSGTTASHTYAAAGTYQVKLTVTDDRGGSGAVTQPVTVKAAPTGPGSLAADSFGREVASGWGTAEVGGAWTTGGAGASVTGGAGSLSTAPGATTSENLGSLSRSDVELRATLTLPQQSTGGGTYVSLATRHVGTTDYRVKVKYTATGAVTASLVAAVNGAETALGSYTVAASLPVGTPLTVAFATVGSGTTTLRVKAWQAGTAEPADWGLTRTDTTAALQRPGSVYLQQYNSGSATAASLVRVDDLGAQPAV